MVGAPVATAHAVAPPLVRHRVGLYGVTAEVVAPREPFGHLLPLPLAAYPAVGADVAADFRIEVLPDEGPDRWVVACGAFRFHGNPGPRMAARRAEWAFADGALRRLSRFIHVHAAVVAAPHQSLLLVGRSGRGKSTTAVGLAQRGLALYTDDVALIERDDLRPRVFPRPIKLDANSRCLLRPLGLEIPGATRLRESVARTALPGLPPLEAPGPPLRMAVFFADERRTRPELRPLSAAEALLRTVQQSSTERLTLAGPPEGALALVNAVRCYELVVGEFAATIDLLLDLARGS